MIKKPRILLASHFGEPIGGITLNYRYLINSHLQFMIDFILFETSKGDMTFNERGQYKIANIVNALENILGFTAKLLSSEIDIVHIGSSYGPSFLKHSIMALISIIFRYKVVMQIHCSFFKLIPKSDSFWGRYVRFIINKLDGLIILSKEWESIAQLAPHTNIYYLPNAIQLTPYILIPRNRLHHKECIEILYLGHIGKDKGCFDLLNAIDNIRSATNKKFFLHFVGETLERGEKEQLQYEVNKKGLDKWIQVHDAEYNESKIERMKTSDIFVLPSYHEGMPISILEAMAAGLPVIASKVGGIIEQVIPEETGLLVEPGDVKGLGEALLKMIENDHLRLKMGLAGRKRAIDEFGIEKKVNKLFEIYQSILDK